MSVALDSTGRAKNFLSVLPAFLNRGFELRLTLTVASIKRTSQRDSDSGSSYAGREVKSLLVLQIIQSVHQQVH
jgi:hypothetical protein